MVGDTGFRCVYAKSEEGCPKNSLQYQKDSQGLVWVQRLHFDVILILNLHGTYITLITSDTYPVALRKAERPMCGCQAHVLGRNCCKHKSTPMSLTSFPGFARVKLSDWYRLAHSLEFARTLNETQVSLSGFNSAVHWYQRRLQCAPQPWRKHCPTQCNANTFLKPTAVP